MVSFWMANDVITVPFYIIVIKCDCDKKQRSLKWERIKEMEER